MQAKEPLAAGLRKYRIEPDDDYGEAYLNVTNADNNCIQIQLEQWNENVVDSFMPVSLVNLDHRAARLLARSILHAIDCDGSTE